MLQLGRARAREFERERLRTVRRVCRVGAKGTRVRSEPSDGATAMRSGIQQNVNPEQRPKCPCVLAQSGVSLQARCSAEACLQGRFASD